MTEVCLPGTGGMVPLPDRWLTCCWIEQQGCAVLIDCGEGTQIALKEADCRLSRLDTLLITHFHADHIAGLPGLLLTLGNSGKTSPLTIIGPEGLNSIVTSLTCIAPALPFPLEILEKDSSHGGEWHINNIKISWLPLNHRIPCFGYSVLYSRKPIFNPQKAAVLGIPKTLYKTLHDGNSVMYNGQLIKPETVLDGQRAPIKICYSTDTLPIEALVEFASGADLLISEGMYGKEEMRRKMTDKMHMLFSDSAKIAKQADVGLLWLTHFSPALTNPDEQLDSARQIFGNTVVAYDGIRANIVK